MFKKIILAVTLLTATVAHAEDPRAFYEFMYSNGTGVSADENLTTIGAGARFTFPVTDDFFLGFKGDVTYTNKGNNGLITHLAFSADLRLKDDLYLTGDIGHAWGYNSVEDENGTVVGYSDWADTHGEYHTVGLKLQLSDYVEVAALYRNTLFNSIGTVVETFRQEEILFSLNFAITRESWEFFQWLSDLGPQR